MRNPKLYILAVLLFSASSVWATTANFCWKTSYGRGAGRPISSCPAGTQKNGALCYPKCRSGYVGVGPVCWQTCPRGFRNDGAFCAKPKPYGRGAGYPWKFGDKPFNLSGAKKRCERSHGSCSKNGALYYPNCKPGFYNFGCCTCSPRCQKGQKDIGVSCAKKSYPRGAGKVLSCAAGTDYDAGLCYRRCRRGFKGVGPVCWGQAPRGWVSCGMGAAKNSQACRSAMSNQVMSVGTLALTVASLGTSTAAVGATKSVSSARKLTELRAKLAKLQQVYKRNKKDIDRLSKAKKSSTARQEAALLRMNARRASPEDIARVSAQIAAVLDPSGVSDTVAAYTFPKCNKVR